MAYVVAHSRPIAEILTPQAQPLEPTFENQFVGMTRESVSLAELKSVRKRLFAWALADLTTNERRFLLSVKLGAPEWGLLPFPDLPRWPAIQWKLKNIRRMDSARHEAATERLRVVLGL